MATGTKLIGVKQLTDNLGRLVKMLDDVAIEDALKKTADELRDQIKARAPLGPTGNLRRSIVSKKFAHKIPGKPGAFVAIDYRIGPHAHLVEYGHIGPGGKQVPAKPFFWPTVRAFQKINNIENALKTQIEKIHI